MNTSSEPTSDAESTPGLRVRAFNCQCGSPIFFLNSTCLACQTPLGYEPVAARLLPLEATDEPDVWVEWQPEGPRYQRCANLRTPAVCNWLVPVDEVAAHESLCRACRLNHIIPDLNDPKHPDNGELWGRIELAKRRLVSALLVMGLPVASRETEDPERGLMFDFLRAVEGGSPSLPAMAMA